MRRLARGAPAATVGAAQLWCAGSPAAAATETVGAAQLRYGGSPAAATETVGAAQLWCAGSPAAAAPETVGAAQLWYGGSPVKHRRVRRVVARRSLAAQLWRSSALRLTA
jgi:hypothetical protein